ncbi:MAG: ketoacyl-ACP synthase III [Oscillospiraceae bacterium]|jgi:3-oxoacyl-[acyl-carrier-protein] synthase-3|nr:ketoacyl-ACP synthase III [Oscillospiraceae bacterium]
MFKIKKTGVYIPEGILDNEYFTKIVETNDEWIRTRTGIKTRHIAEEKMYEMAGKAARVVTADINVDDIDLIVVSTITPEYYFPSTACLVAKEIGAKNARCFDVSAACAGFNYALDIVSRYNYKNALVISSEKLTGIVDYTDRTTCVLFGDGAAAVLLEPDSTAPYGSFLGADADGAMCIYAEQNGGKLIQNGKEVYKFATKILPLCVEKACENVGWSVSEIDWVIPHQANLRIIETAAKNLNVDLSKFIVTIEDYGNTSSSSIPIALNEGIVSGRIKRGDKVCLVGFGSGLVYGANLFVY